MRCHRLFALAAALTLGRMAAAQVPPPFYSPIGTAFTPEIGVVNTGVLQDVQAVVTPDLRYVTLTMGVSNSNLLALREFTFQNGTPPANNIAGQGNAPAPIQVTFLDLHGITRVDAP